MSLEKWASTLPFSLSLSLFLSLPLSFSMSYHVVTDPQMREYSCKVGTHFFPLSLSLSLYLSLSFLLPVYEGVLLQRWHQLRSAETNTVHGMDHIRLDKKFFLVLIFVHFFPNINNVHKLPGLVGAVGPSCGRQHSRHRLSQLLGESLCDGGFVCDEFICNFFGGLFCGAPQ